MKVFNSFLVMCLVAFLVFHPTECNTVDNLYTSYSDIYKALRSRNGSSIPVNGDMPPKTVVMSMIDNQLLVTASASFAIERILTMDLEQQLLCVLIKEKYTWQDSSLKWENQNNNKELKTVSLPRKEIWTPVELFPHSMEVEVKRTVDDDVTVTANGECSLVVKTEVNVHCNVVSGRKFPFDVHKCSLKLSTKMAKPVTLKLETATPSPSASAATKDNHLNWKLLEGVIQTSQNGFEVQMDIKVRYKGAFYIVVVLCPIIICNIISLLMFVRPLAAREHVALTLNLTYILIILITESNSPPSGDQTPMVILYIVLCEVLALLTYIMTIIQLKLHNHWQVKHRSMQGSLSKFLESCCRMRKRFDQQHKYSLHADESDIGSHTEEMHANHAPREKVTNEYEVYKWTVLTDTINFFTFLVMLIAHIILPIILFI